MYFVFSTLAFDHAERDIRGQQNGRFKAVETATRRPRRIPDHPRPQACGDTHPARRTASSPATTLAMAVVSKGSQCGASLQTDVGQLTRWFRNTIPRSCSSETPFFKGRPRPNKASRSRARCSIVSSCAPSLQDPRRGHTFTCPDCNRRYDVVNRGFSGYNSTHALKYLPQIFAPASESSPRIEYIVSHLTHHL